MEARTTVKISKAALDKLNRIKSLIFVKEYKKVTSIEILERLIITELERVEKLEAKK